MSAAKISGSCADTRAVSHSAHLSYCNGCRKVYCDACYDGQVVHYDDADRLHEHEKTDLQVAKFVLTLFETTTAPPGKERDRQHLENVYSKWFGTHIDRDAKRSFFNDFGGFVRLMQEERPTPLDQYPSLISFVGDTGTGKSTLINGILKLPTTITEYTLPDDPLTRSPVMGTTYEQIVPTSGDVHIFGDKKTWNTQHPMIYVDCEGMGGGETPPAGAKCLEKLSRFGDVGASHIVENSREIIPFVPREWTVNQLYPRILFPFSDVVCYVTINARQFEPHLENLLRWAHKAIDKTTNQPMLPHVFMIINAFKVDREAPKDCFSDWWDVEKVTEEILRTHDTLINSSSPVISNLVNYWNGRGRRIKTLTQLLHCYYSSFKVICIPDIKHTQHSHITNQYRKLQDAITTASTSCRKGRNKSGSLMSAEALERYFNMAFDHFTTKPDMPFNFLSAALLQTPVTQTFKDHICKLAVRYMKAFPAKNGREIFTELAPWVASCIFLDSHRLELPNNDVADTILEGYKVSCLEAQSEFFNRYWPCEAVADATKNNTRCVNMKSAHTAKGHQDSSGNIFVSQDPEFLLNFKSCFESRADKEQENKVFMEEVSKELKLCIANYQDHTYDNSQEERKKAAARIHKTIFERFNTQKCGDFMVKDLVSHKTCFCCLTSSPAHKLFCGHLICQLCLEDYSLMDPRDTDYRVFRACPMCGFETGQQLKLEMKPPNAGLRILCLDGGGIRAIMQLEILKELEHRTGLDIPIIRFFDLVVGTSGGGIVAAGLGLERTPTDECITLFKNFAKNAFVKRPAIDWPIIGDLVMARHHGRYKTSALERVLKEAFGEKYIFGATLTPQSAIIPSLKVAFTATSMNRTPFLLTNYNRPPPEKNLSKGMIFDRKECFSEFEETTSQMTGSPRTDSEDSQETGQERIEKTTSASSEENDDDHSVDNSDSSEADTPTSPGSNSTGDPLGSISRNGRGNAEFFRGEDLGSELKIWEAIRASSAAPTYFKSFTHNATKYTFDDGALKCNNPVFIADKERKILWPQFSRQDPDILLSIGTGYSSLAPSSAAGHEQPRHRGVRNFVQKLAKLGKDAINEDMDCGNIWEEYVESLKLDPAETERKERYRRLNPPLEVPMPKLDDIAQLSDLQTETRDYMARQITEITRIARQLVGTLFYFELQSVSRVPGTDWKSLKGMGQDLECVGSIKCRVYSKKLERRMRPHESPSTAQEKNTFLIGENLRNPVNLKFTPTAKAAVTGGKLSYDVEFILKNQEKDRKMSMYLSIWSGKPVCISGFPRNLFLEAECLFNRGSSNGRSRNSSVS